MRKVGLTVTESQIVSAVAPLGKIQFHYQLYEHLHNVGTVRMPHPFSTHIIYFQNCLFSF